MSRELVLGNGNMLVCFDKDAQIGDFYFPYVGMENHIGKGGVNKVGIWTEGRFSWLSDNEWNITSDYQKETMVSDVNATNDSLGVRLRFEDVVYNERNIYIRRVTVDNAFDRKRIIKLFFNHQFQISQTGHADTAYYNPNIESIIHYKGRRVILTGGRADGKPFDDYSVGLFGIEGKQGTWKDADDDGQLSKNPIEHGSVDSTLAFTLDISPGESKTVWYWIAVGETFKEAERLQEYIVSRTPDHIFETTKNYWHAWVNKKEFTFYGLDPKVVELFKKSLLIIRTHCNNNGAILASGDSDNFQYGRDTYGYIWPRDGAFVAVALDKAGYHDMAKRFYSFCNDIVTGDGYVLHKYQADKSLGSSWHPWIKDGKKQLAIQEDETALLLYGLWQHYEQSKDLEFVEEVYNSFIKSMAEFLVHYRDTDTNLPGPSYDLWEEKFGISTFTTCTVYAGLLAASYFANLLGKEKDKRRYLDHAEIIKEEVLKRMFNPESGYPYKLINMENGVEQFDTTIDASSFFGLFRFNLLPVHDPRMKRAYEYAKEKISKPIPMGGVARYENDHYYQISTDVPGNPWFITTLWFLQYEIMCADTEIELKKIASDLMWIVEKALRSGMLSEQVNPFTAEQVSVAPLTWSHGEYVYTVVKYLERLEELGIHTVCHPVR